MEDPRNDPEIRRILDEFAQLPYEGQIKMLSVIRALARRAKFKLIQDGKEVKWTGRKIGKRRTVSRHIHSPPTK